MDVKVKSDGIHYLSRDAMLPYSDMAFLSNDGKVVRMSALVLAALNASVMNSLPLPDQDFQDC